VFLGAISTPRKVLQKSDITDLNDYIGENDTEILVFVTSNSVPQNVPAGFTSVRFWIKILNISNSYIHQLIINRNGETYGRVKDTGVWKPWSRIDNL
jgi:hypothetical protein